jgi:hypothetical protein
MAISLTAAALHAALTGHSLTVSHGKHSDISECRNGLVVEALKDDPYAIMWIDSDNVVPSNVITALLARDLPYVGCFYSTRRPPYEIVGALEDPASASQGGVQRASVLPGGCCLVLARIYRKLSPPWYWESYHPELATPANPRGFQSDDVNFQRRVERELGIPAYADLDLFEGVGHSGLVTVYPRSNRSAS